METAGLHCLAAPLPPSGLLPGSAWRPPRPGSGVTSLKHLCSCCRSASASLPASLPSTLALVIFTPCLPPLARRLQNTPFLPASRSSCSKAASSAFCPDHCVPLAFALGALGVECGAALSAWTVPVVAAGPGGRQVPFLLWAPRHELLFSLGTVVQVSGSTATLVGCVLESGPRLS